MRGDNERPSSRPFARDIAAKPRARLRSISPVEMVAAKFSTSLALRSGGTTTRLCSTISRVRSRPRKDGVCAASRRMVTFQMRASAVQSFPIPHHNVASGSMEYSPISTGAISCSSIQTTESRSHRRPEGAGIRPSTFTGTNCRKYGRMLDRCWCSSTSVACRETDSSLTSRRECKVDSRNLTLSR